MENLVLEVNCLVLKDSMSKFPVVMRLWDTPVPIPNTKVKTQSADDTWLETARESKWLPESIRAHSSAG